MDQLPENLEQLVKARQMYREKLELEERDKDVKLKNQREFEYTIATLNRSIEKTVTENNKHKLELPELEKIYYQLQNELVVEKIELDALVVQENKCKKYLADLNVEFEQTMSEVWEIRSKICEYIQQISDEYDLRALLNRPVTHESQKNTQFALLEDKPSEINGTLLYEGRLKEALARKQKAIEEHDRLLVEPDTDEKFIRYLNFGYYKFD